MSTQVDRPCWKSQLYTHPAHDWRDPDVPTEYGHCPGATVPAPPSCPTCRTPMRRNQVYGTWYCEHPRGARRSRVRRAWDVLRGRA